MTWWRGYTIQYRTAVQNRTWPVYGPFPAPPEPVLRVLAATGTGDLITDALRALGTEGDARTAPDSSVGIYEARTNLLPNGGFEQDVRYWAGTLCTIARSTDWAVFGAASGKVTITDNGSAVARTNGAIIGSPITAGTYTGVVQVYVPTGSTLIGKSGSLYLYESGGSQAAAIASAGRTTSITLTAGWQEAIITADVVQVDRTELSLRLQINGAVIGETCYLDGGAVYAEPVPHPAYVESSEVLVPYAPSPNLATNGDFETNTTGWSQLGVTLAQDTLHAHNGTKSLKVTATAAGTVYATHWTFVSGAPIAQTAHAFGVWYWAEGTVVGKTAQVVMMETGGASGNGTTAVTSQVLTEGWNYILCTGTVQQADRTNLRIYCYLLGAAIGDVYWLDDIRAGQPYVTPTPSTVSRTAGRVTVADTGLSTRQGWVALRVRPGWRAAPHTWLQRPTMPVTLWEWQADASNYLRLSFDGGYLVMERSNASGTDTARSPWAPERGSEALVAGAWDADGVYASAEGRGLIGTLETFASDDFTRADAATLGTTPVGGFAWIESGASNPRIFGNRMEPDAVATGNGYAYLDLGEVPYRWGGVVSYTGTDAALNTTQAYDDPSQPSVTNTLHMLLDRTHWVYQTVQGGVFELTNLERHTYAAAIASDGSPHTQVIAVDGDTVVVEEHDGSVFSFKDALVPGLLFPRVFWEVRRDATGVARWDSIFAQRRGIWTPDGGHIPTIPEGTGIDLCSTDGTSDHFDGDVLWYAAGRGPLTDADAATMAGYVDPANALPRNAEPQRIVHFWKANDVT